METVDVLIVGAGMSGIGAAYYVQKNCPDKSYRILESRDTQGGTWSLFKYPGIRSDSDMYTFGYSFEPWINKSSISDGNSILQYSKDTSKRYRIDDHIKYSSSVKRATWDTAQHMWIIDYTYCNVATRMRCRFLYLCTGYYSYESGFTPDFPGRERFRGEVVHPQSWPTDLDYSDKKVVVIGSGATAITLIPSLLSPPDGNTPNQSNPASHVTMLQRSPSYVVAAPSEDKVATMIYKYLPRFLAFTIIRWRKVYLQYMMYTLSRKYPVQTKKAIKDDIVKALGPDFDVDKHFSPKYDPWDQRLCLCPEGDFFTALKSGQASIVTDHIDHFSEKGIVLKEGGELEADIVVTATGLNLKAMGGIEFNVDGESVDISRCFVYKGCMVSGLPNMGWWIGYTNASYTLKSDLTSYYFSRLINYMDRNNYTSCVPTPRDASMSGRSLLSLTSGYMTRGMHLYPKQGLRAPWSYNNNYFVDWYVLCFGAVRNKELVFSSLQCKMPK